jgi:PIN domain nuclease of toxin-antitoxin system
MTIAAVADTHVIIWYLYNDRRLSSNARAYMETAAGQGNQIGISSVSLVEIVYLIEKGKIPVETFTVVATTLGNPNGVLIEIMLDLRIARIVSRVAALMVPDMPDRIIAATALHLGVPLISRDAKIQASNISTIW